MLTLRLPIRSNLAAGCLAAALWGAGLAPLHAQEAEFYEAYFLENDQRDFAGAVALYEQVLASPGASAELRARIEQRLAACREELSSADFSRLMPPDPWLYVELTRPGDQLEKLLSGLGLMDSGGEESRGKRLQVSPALVEGLFDLRGAALAVTGMDPRAQRPHGVLVLHPGNLDVVRGLIETALPAGAETLAPIEGAATYALEEGLIVSLTERLIVVGTQRTQVRGVLRRLHGSDESGKITPSLATSALAPVLKQRGDALLFACLNPKPLMPLLQMAAGQSEEAAMIQSLLDPESLETIVVRAGVEHDGLGVEIGMQLSPDHGNLAFDLVRLPAVERELIACVPEGAAGLIALGLNHAQSGRVSERGVSVMDVGRELFGNLRGVALYTMPGSDGPMPRIGGVLHVNDPSASEELWGKLLAVATLAGGGGSSQETYTHEGTELSRYAFQEGVDVYRATSGARMLLATDRDLLERSLRTVTGAPSVFEDAGLRAVLGSLTPTHSLFAAVHAGRFVEVVAPLEGGHTHESLQVAALLKSSALSLGVEQDSARLRLSVRFQGLPDVSDLVSQQLNMGGGAASTDRRVAWADESQGAHVNSSSAAAKQIKPTVEERLMLLAGADAEELNEAIAEMVATEGELSRAKWLNGTAWNYLTEAQFDGGMDRVALVLAERANELTAHSDWAHLDTLALALFRQGEVDQAIAKQERAVEMAARKSDREEALVALARYRRHATRPAEAH